MTYSIRFTVLLSCFLLASVASSCQIPPEQQPETKKQSSNQIGETLSTSQPNDVKNKEKSWEEIAAVGVQQALESAPQVADEINNRYWFSLPNSIPWWIPQAVVYEEGDRSQGAIRLHFHKQNYRSQGRFSDELALLWQQGRVEGSPDIIFEWATKAGIDVGEKYILSDTCVIDEHECQVYLHRRMPRAGNIIWRVWYDDKADLTYALVIPEQEPVVGLSFEQEFHGSKR